MMHLIYNMKNTILAGLFIFGLSVGAASCGKVVEDITAPSEPATRREEGETLLFQPSTASPYPKRRPERIHEDSDLAERLSPEKPWPFEIDKPSPTFNASARSREGWSGSGCVAPRARR